MKPSDLDSNLVSNVAMCLICDRPVALVKNSMQGIEDWFSQAPTPEKFGHYLGNDEGGWFVLSEKGRTETDHWTVKEIRDAVGNLFAEASFWSYYSNPML